jgi:succinate dehydrogenase hydrophobic anchor subunit
LVALVAALLFAWAGISMLSLQTVNGNTVAELFDNYVGIFCLGMAALTLVIVAPARRD